MTFVIRLNTPSGTPLYLSEHKCELCFLPVKEIDFATHFTRRIHADVYLKHLAAIDEVKWRYGKYFTDYMEVVQL